jgi:hypothetical protein
MDTNLVKMSADYADYTDFLYSPALFADIFIIFAAAFVRAVSHVTGQSRGGYGYSERAFFLNPVTLRRPVRRE